MVEDVHKLDSPFSGKPWSCKIYCCYDGLALIRVRNYRNEDLIRFLWNPSTKESIVLPSPAFPPTAFCNWGLGYDSTSDDYKILKTDRNARSKIFALKSGSRRKIDKHPFGIYPMLSNMESLAFKHGAFHWLDLSLNKSVVSFNISNEVYAEIPLLDGMFVVSDRNYLKPHGVLVLGVMLCVYSTCTHPKEYTFDYGVKESWNQLFTIQSTDLYSITPKYRFSDGEVLLCCGHLKRIGFEFKTDKESSGLWPQSDLEYIQNGFVYTESLISPKLLA